MSGVGKVSEEYAFRHFERAAAILKWTDSYGDVYIDSLSFQGKSFISKKDTLTIAREGCSAVYIRLKPVIQLSKSPHTFLCKKFIEAGVSAEWVAPTVGTLLLQALARVSFSGHSPKNCEKRDTRNAGLLYLMRFLLSVISG